MDPVADELVIEPYFFSACDVGDKLSYTLVTAAEALEEGREKETLADIARQWREKVFRLAVVGQFKRGKSTLINALIRKAILAVGVVPLTAIPTFLRPGIGKSCVVEYPDGRSENVPLEAMARYVSESENPKNVNGVSQV